MHANPFATLPAEASPIAEEATRQPLALALTAAVATMLSVLLGCLSAWLSHPTYLDHLLSNLPVQLAGWCFSILLSAWVTALFSRGYLEHHGSALTRPLPLLVVLGVTWVLADLAYGLLTGWMLGGLYEWFNEHALPPTLLFELLGLLGFAITGLLPLWLGLRLGAKTPAVKGFAQRGEASLLLAGTIALLSFKGLQLLPAHLLSEIDGWATLLFVAPVLYAALVFACAWQTLPPRLARIRPGQLVLTALAIFLVWLLVHLLVAGVLLVSAFSGSDALLQPEPLIIAGLAVLALLWPLTLLGLSWIYRAEAA